MNLRWRIGVYKWIILWIEDNHSKQGTIKLCAYFWPIRYVQRKIDVCKWWWQRVVLTLQWRHDDHNGVSNHQRLDCLLSRLFRHRSKKTSKLRVTGLCEGNSPVTGEFPTQKTSNAENVSIWWRDHDVWPYMSDAAHIVSRTDNILGRCTKGVQTWRATGKDNHSVGLLTLKKLLFLTVGVSDILHKPASYGLCKRFPCKQMLPITAA